MLITKTPLRISFCGGGTDLASFYRKHGGCTLSTTIDKYIYIVTLSSFDRSQTILKYSKVETIYDVSKIEHPIFRECLKKYRHDGLEISSMADVPAGTGLGSSSSFTVGLANVLSAYAGKDCSSEYLAQTACDMEIGILNEPIGKQDQYAAAYGGLRYYEFNKDETVNVEKVDVPDSGLKYMEDNLMMFYLGGTRSASDILKVQSSNSSSGKTEENLIRMCGLTKKLKVNLEAGDYDSLGEILDEGWKNKKTLAKGISNEFIDGIYDRALECGSTGGKLLGAGGNGFMLFYVPKGCHEKMRSSLSDLKEMRFRFEPNGSSIVYDDRHKSIR